jgi:acyl-CoA thioesterase-1
VVVIELGANDALRGQPIAAIRANLEKMISLTREARAEPVLVGLMIPPNYGIEYATEFRDLFRRSRANTRSRFVPFLLQNVAERRELSRPTSCIRPRKRSPSSSTTCGRRSPGR